MWLGVAPGAPAQPLHSRTDYTCTWHTAGFHPVQADQTPALTAAFAVAAGPLAGLRHNPHAAGVPAYPSDSSPPPSMGHRPTPAQTYSAAENSGQYSASLS